MANSCDIIPHGSEKSVKLRSIARLELACAGVLYLDRARFSPPFHPLVPQTAAPTEPSDYFGHFCSKDVHWLYLSALSHSASMQTRVTLERYHKDAHSYKP